MGRIKNNNNNKKTEGGGVKRVGGGGRKIEILSTATSTQSPNHKTNKKKPTYQAKNSVNKLIKLREIPKCLLTRFS